MLSSNFVIKIRKIVVPEKIYMYIYIYVSIYICFQSNKLKKKYFTDKIYNFPDLSCLLSSRAKANSASSCFFASTPFFFGL